MWNKVKELSEIGLNKSQIAMELSIDRKTVKKMLRMSLDDYIDLVYERLELFNSKNIDKGIDLGFSMIKKKSS